MEIQNLINQTKIELNYQLDNINHQNLIYVLSKITEKNIIYISGVGKSESIAIHISSILKSIGVKCFHLNILNSLHGDIGTIEENDLLILLSKSGNTEEIISKINNFKLKKCFILGITMNINSKFKNLCDETIVLPFKTELKLVNDKIPTNSCISFLNFFNIISSLLTSHITMNEYAINHSSGTIGNSLKRIKDIVQYEFPKIYFTENIKINTICLEMTKYSIGCAFFVNKNEELIGIITDGDIRRLIARENDINLLNYNYINTSYIFETDTNKFIKDININLKYIPVLHHKKLIGIIDCLRSITN